MEGYLGSCSPPCSWLNINCHLQSATWHAASPPSSRVAIPSSSSIITTSSTSTTARATAPTTTMVPHIIAKRLNHKSPKVLTLSPQNMKSKNERNYLSINLDLFGVSSPSILWSITMHVGRERVKEVVLVINRLQKPWKTEKQTR